MPDAASHHPVMCERSPPTLASCNYNLDRFNREHRTHLVETAPADLTGLSDTDLKELDYACTALWPAPGVEELHRRVWDERDARKLNDTFKREVAA